MSPIDDDCVDDADTERADAIVDDDDDPPYNPPSQAQVLPWWA